MKPFVGPLVLGLAALGWAQSCRAAALTVSPILIEAATPGRSAILTLRNRDGRPIDAQVRVFAWTQRDGVDHLEPTTAVVASPPIVEIAPRGTHLVRLQRVATGEPAAEEAYRVVVDELPDMNRQRNGAITVLLRYSIPMFFSDPEATQPRLAWTLRAAGATRMLTAENTGDKRVQITGLTVKTGTRTLTMASGLAGYVLGHSMHGWTVPANASLVHARVAAGSDHGPVNAALVP